MIGGMDFASGFHRRNGFHIRVSSDGRSFSRASSGKVLMQSVPGIVEVYSFPDEWSNLFTYGHRQ